MAPCIAIQVITDHHSCNGDTDLREPNTFTHTDTHTPWPVSIRYNVCTFTQWKLLEK